MRPSPLSRLVGPSALSAGILIVIAQAMMLPFDPKDHVATTQEPVFRIGGVVYLIGFCLLLIALVAIWERLDGAAGRFGTPAFLVALVGTFMLGGDLWFETFAVPWLSDQAPAALDTDPTTLLALGALSSYFLFAAGWALFGIACLRAHVFPAPICLAMAVSGVIGFQALLAPWAVPLALSVAALGAWILRTGSPIPDAQLSSTDVRPLPAPPPA